VSGAGCGGSAEVGVLQTWEEWGRGQEKRRNGNSVLCVTHDDMLPLVIRISWFLGAVLKDLLVIDFVEDNIDFYQCNIFVV
jgi:hypothetical protein